MNLWRLLNAFIQRQIRRRFPPLVRAGYHNVRDGMATGSSLQASMGAAMIAVGYLQRRSRRRTLLYAGPMQLGQSMRIRVHRGGKTIDEVIVNG